MQLFYHADSMVEIHLHLICREVEKLSYLDALVENIRKMKIYIFFEKNLENKPSIIKLEK